ncbi:MAG: glycoside hydrolase family 3 N-terminal domain-containing protein, partial [Parvibaculales bacterium]
MCRHIYIVLVLMLPLLGCGGGGVVWPKASPPVLLERAGEKKINAIVSRMSVSQMVGQMIQASVEGLTLAEMRRFMPGAIAVSGTWAPDGQASASARERVGVASEFYLASKQVGAQIPAFWGSGGAEVPFPSAQNFPDNIALGAAGNVEFSRLVGKERALQAVSLGMDFMPLPVLSIAHNLSYPEFSDSFSQDPEAVKSHAAAM